MEEEQIKRRVKFGSSVDWQGRRIQSSEYGVAPFIMVAQKPLTQ
jgi:hypothetical protein